MTALPVYELDTFARLKATVFRLRHPTKQKFECPICTYHGPFRDLRPETGVRIHAMCPSCRSLERHRLQYLVACKVFGNLETKSMRMLHFAPETYFNAMFGALFGRYETADIEMPHVNHRVDLRELPFDACSYDVIYASHVLEHIREDRKAIEEIRRVLAPGGLAILPVPLGGSTTVEYAEPSLRESMHVRAPGLDYFDRYSPHFSKIELYRSDAFSEKYQPFAYGDRSKFQSKDSLQILAGDGVKSVDIVPVCWV